MNYATERWLKVYTRNTGGWLNLSWQARGLSLEITRYLDASGRLPLGRQGLAALAGVLRGRWEDMAPFIAELVDDGRLEVLDGNILHDPGHVARQEARTSPAERKRAQRERHAESRDVTRRHTVSSAKSDPAQTRGATGHVAQRDAPSQRSTGTPSNENCEQFQEALSRDVTRSHITSRSEESRREEILTPLPSVAPPTGATPPKSETKVSPPRGTRLPTGWTPSAEAQAWAKAQGVADPCGKILEEFHDYWGALPGARGVKLDWDATYRNQVRRVGAIGHRGTPGKNLVQSAVNRSWKLPEGLE